MSELTSQELRARAAQSRQDALYYRKRPEPLTEECADALDIAAGAREKLADAIDEIGRLRAEVARLQEELNDSCACKHDGRGGLVIECQEHQEQRERGEQAEKEVAWLQLERDNETTRACKYFNLADAQEQRADRAEATLAAVRATLPDQVVSAVAELPDRTSPDDWPEAMLVTADELRQIVTGALSALCGGDSSKARAQCDGQEG